MNPPAPEIPPPPPTVPESLLAPEPTGPPSLTSRIFRRVILGLLFVLPVLLTLIIVYQIYRILNQWIIVPVALLIIPEHIDNPHWSLIKTYVTPPISLTAVLIFLFLMGHLFQTRMNVWVDWIFEHLPGISILYRAVRDAASAVQGPSGLKRIDKVVLVPFPHPGARAAGYLMGESEDEATGTKLACVYIPIAVFPPSGYTLIFLRADVTMTQWDPAMPWKLMLTGGLTLPVKVPWKG